MINQYDISHTESDNSSMTEKSDQSITDDNISMINMDDLNHTDTGMTEMSDSGITGMTESDFDHTKLESMIRSVVREELNGLLRQFVLNEQEPFEKTVKKSFTIPAGIWRELQKLGGNMSRHVTNALRTYLALQKKSE